MTQFNVEFITEHYKKLWQVNSWFMFYGFKVIGKQNNDVKLLYT